MIKKKLALLLATAMTASVLSTGFSNEIVAYAETTTQAQQTYTDRVYLSDLNYIEGKAYAGTIINDAHSSGSKIRLKVNGSVVTFNRGVYAHADSELIYDVEEQINKGFNTFIAYMGVDASQNGRGNVIFKVSVSNDKEEWQVLKTTEALTSSSNAVKIQEELPEGTKYLRLQADPNGHNGNDHAAYGDAILVGDDYLNVKMPEGMKAVAELDQQIIALDGSATDIASTQGHKLYQREFIKRVDYDILTRIYRDEPQYSESISYLFENEKALAYFIETGVGDSGDSYVTVLKNFDLIYKKYKDEIKNDDFLLKLAVTTSWAFAQNVYFWANHYDAQNVVERFEIYKDFATVTDEDWSWSQSEIDFFKNQSPAMLKYTLNSRQNNDEIKWFADYIKNVKDGSMNGYHYVEYKGVASFTQPQYYGEANFDTWDAKYNLSKYNINTDDSNKVRWYAVMEVDGVCGAIAKTYTALQETFGRPSGVVHQPGHAASLVCNEKGEWSIVNDVSGWPTSKDEMRQMPLTWGMQSWNTDTSASYILLTQHVLDDYEAYQMATKLNILSDVYKSNQEKREEALTAALEAQSKNLDAMYNLIQAYKADNTKTSEDYIELARKVTEKFKYYPLAMADLLVLIQPNIDSADLALFDLIRTNALKDASVATDANVKQPGIAKTMANHLLNSNGSAKRVNTFTFSFSGDKANKLVVDNKYSDSQFATRYSIDGGVNWTDTTDFPEIDLSDVADQINAEDDILIKILGANDVYKIDIKETKAPTNATLYKNDLENRLIGNITNLEISLDGGETWCDYTEDMKISGEVVSLVRYKANGTNLKSPNAQYTFKEDTSTPERNYVTIDKLKLHSFSSQQSDSRDHSAKNIIDGTESTAWHTKFNATDDGKFYVVELDKVRYITSVEYKPAGVNGRLKGAEVYTSFDGENWTKSGEATGFANNENIKVIDLENPTATKYVKVVAKGTYGNYQQEHNKYFSGKMLNFFEDSTKIYTPEPVITYSTKEKTAENVKVTIELAEGCKLLSESNTYTFTNNGTYTFKYTDIDGLEKSVEAKVDWIDKEVPKDTVSNSESDDGTKVIDTIETEEDVTDENPEVKEENPEVKDESTEVKEENPEVKDESTEVKEENPEVKDENVEVKEENPEAKDESTEVKEENPEVKDESTEVKEENPEVKAESAEVKEENPEVKDESTEVKEENPEVKAESAEVKEENPEVKAESTEIKEENQEVKSESTEVKEENPEVKDESTEVKEENPEVKDESTEVKEENPEVKAESIEVKVENPEVKAESIEVKVENPEVKAESIEVKVENPEVKAESTEVKDENPEVKAESTEVKVENPEVKAESTEVKAENPEVKAESIEVKDENPEVKAESIEVKTESTEIKEETTEVKAESTEVKEENPEVKAESTEVKEENPEAKEESTEVKEENPEVKAESTEVKDENPEINKAAAYLLLPISFMIGLIKIIKNKKK